MSSVLMESLYHFGSTSESASRHVLDARQFAREWLPLLRRDLQRAELITTRTGS